MSEQPPEVVASGSWIYDGTVTQPVFIVRLSFDFWHEIAKEDGTLESDDQAVVNDEGAAYYVSFHGVRADGSFWPDSIGRLSAEAAKTAASTRVPSKIRWHSPMTR